MPMKEEYILKYHKVYGITRGISKRHNDSH